MAARCDAGGQQFYAQRQVPQHAAEVGLEWAGVPIRPHSHRIGSGDRGLYVAAARDLLQDSRIQNCPPMTQRQQGAPAAAFPAPAIRHTAVAQAAPAQFDGGAMHMAEQYPHISRRARGGEKRRWSDPAAAAGDADVHGSERPAQRLRLLPAPHAPEAAVAVSHAAAGGGESVAVLASDGSAAAAASCTADGAAAAVDCADAAVSAAGTAAVSADTSAAAGTAASDGAASVARQSPGSGSGAATDDAFILGEPWEDLGCILGAVGSEQGTLTELPEGWECDVDDADIDRYLMGCSLDSLVEGMSDDELEFLAASLGDSDYTAVA